MRQSKEKRLSQRIRWGVFGDTLLCPGTAFLSYHEATLIVPAVVHILPTFQVVKSTRYTRDHTNLIHTDPPVHLFTSSTLWLWASSVHCRFSTQTAGDIIALKCIFSRYIVLAAAPTQTDSVVANVIVHKLFSEHGEYLAS